MNFESGCSHQELITSEGVVCMHCGLVLDQIYVAPSYPPSSPINVPHCELAEICEKLCYPLDLLPIVRKKLRTSVHHSNNIHSKIILYHVMEHAGFRRTIPHFAKAAGLHPFEFTRALAKMQKTDFSFTLPPADPAGDTLDVFLSELPQLKGSEKEAIRRKITLMNKLAQLSAFSERTKFASAAFLHLREKDKTVTVHNFAKKFSFSVSSISRCIKTFLAYTTSN